MPSDVQPRKSLTKLEFGQLVFEQGGLCGCLCGRALVFKKGQIRDEHLNPLANGGGNELSNRSLWRLDCAKAKDVVDAKRRAKIRSLTQSTKNSQKPKQVIPSRKMQSRNSFKRSQAMSGWMDR